MIRLTMITITVLIRRSGGHTVINDEVFGGYGEDEWCKRQLI